MKKLLSNSSSQCNGDIPLTSTTTKRSHSHHRQSSSSYSRVPQIVLIPQQSHPLSLRSENVECQTNAELFNSNMYLLEQHLKHLIDKQKADDDKNEIINEWKLMALIMDRILFWLFAFLTIISTLICLIIIPCLKNVGYIPVFSKDLLRDNHLTETLRNVMEEQIQMNLTETLT